MSRLCKHCLKRHAHAALNLGAAKEGRASPRVLEGQRSLSQNPLSPPPPPRNPHVRAWLGPSTGPSSDRPQGCCGQQRARPGPILPPDTA